MNLYQRDLRCDRLDFKPHLSSHLKAVVVAFYFLVCVGLTALTAYGVQIWKIQRQAASLKNDLEKASEQQRMVASVMTRLNKRRELVSDIQAWLRDRFDLEAIYHHCVSYVPSNMLLQSFSVQHHPENWTVEFKIAVEGDPKIYNSFFRALTAYFTSAPEMKIADIQMDMRPGGALLTIELLTNDGQVSFSASANKQAIAQRLHD